MEEKENRLNIAMSNDDIDDQDVPEQQNKEVKGGMNQSYDKIRKFIQKSNQQEKLEFTQGLLNFANKIDRRFLTEGLLPNLELLAKETN
jgi:hypothetical protein